MAIMKRNFGQTSYHSEYSLKFWPKTSLPAPRAYEMGSQEVHRTRAR